MIPYLHYFTTMYIYFYSNSKGAAMIVQRRILDRLTKRDTQLFCDFGSESQHPFNAISENYDLQFRPVLPDIDLFILDFTDKKKDLKFIVAKASILQKNILCLCSSTYNDMCYYNLRKWQNNNLVMHEYTYESIDEIINSFLQKIVKDT